MAAPRDLGLIARPIRALLVRHPQVETETARIRLVDFGPSAIELELFAHVLTADTATFMAVREELLLRAAAIVESSGASFARPTEFFYVPERSQAAGVGAE